MSDKAKDDLKAWATREAEKAPPLRPEQVGIILSAFRSTIRGDRQES